MKIKIKGNILIFIWIQFFRMECNVWTEKFQIMLLVSVQLASTTIRKSVLQYNKGIFISPLGHQRELINYNLIKSILSSGIVKKDKTLITDWSIIWLDFIIRSYTTSSIILCKNLIKLCHNNLIELIFKLNQK